MSAVIKLSAPATREFWEIPVLFEDEHLLALDKPSGLLTSPDRYDPERPNLMRLLHRDIERGAAWARERNLDYLMNAHRLDFETSGVILLARNKPALIALANLFSREKPLKTYAALVHGGPVEDTFTVDARLAQHPSKPGLMRVDPRRGKRSLTEFTVRERFNRFTLLEARPRTGRTHQIRIHCAHLRLRIVGDKTYNGGLLWLSKIKPNYRLGDGKKERALLARTALHAETLTLDHPITGAPVTITAPWPKDMLVAVKYLRRFAAQSGNQVGPESSADSDA